MSFRLPQSLGPAIDARGGISAFEQEVMAEKAASLGRAGGKLSLCLAALRADPASSRDDDLIQAAADAAYACLIQRELCGLVDESAFVEDYDIPRSVVGRMGAVHPPRP